MKTFRIAIAALALLPVAAPADMVELKNGSVLEGTYVVT